LANAISLLRMKARAAGRGESTRRTATRAALGALAGATLWLGVTPAVAGAHGPVAPVATSYLARIRSVPAGLQAKIVDGYVRMWLRVDPAKTVTVLDYRGVPYVRFTRSGVAVNESSEMYYLNQTPYPWAVPAGLTRRTPARWLSLGGGHTYEWHDGRLQALASVALAPGTAYVGRWSIPILLDGRPTVIAGGLWHAPKPSIVWFWPLIVLVACALAAWRVHSATLDARVARILGTAGLIGLVVACVARELHGRPGVSPFQYVELACVSLFALWELWRLLLDRAGFFSYALIAFVALWQGLDLVPTLVNGFVLVELPAAVVRAAAVTCLGCAVGLALVVFRLDDLDEIRSRRRLRRRPASEGMESERARTARSGA
jgi:hypothetical protein